MSRRRPRVIRNKGVIAAARLQRTPPPGARLPFQVDPWTRRLVRPLLIAAVATAPALGMLVIVSITQPDEPWLKLGWLCFFAALEGAYTAAWLHHPDSRVVDRGAYRVTEVFLLLVLARVVSWVVFGVGWPSPDEMRVFLSAPLSFVMVGNFLTTAFVTLFAWYVAVTMGRLFAELDVGVEEVQFYTLSPAEQQAQADDRPISTPRGVLQAQYMNRWIGVGVLMVLLAALSTFEVGQFATVTNVPDIARLGLRPAMLFALLLYFLGGLWLLSHARLLRLNAQWLADGFGKEADLERAWQRSALLVVLLIAFAAAFLPIGSTLGISRILQLLLNILFYIAGLIFAAVGFLFAGILRLFVSNAEQMPLVTPEPAPTFAPTPVPTPPAQTNPAFAFVLTSIFWAVLIALVIGALVFFLRERGYRLDFGRMQRSVSTLGEQARALWRRLRRRAKAMSHTLRERLQPPADAAAPTAGPHPLDLGRRRAMTPREQIRAYYLAAVRRAGQSGVPRADNATPLEYVRELKEHWPEAEAELDELTEAFVEARYSPRPIDHPMVARVKAEWKRLRERLRRAAPRS